MKNYMLHKIEKFGINMKEIIYDFKVKDTNKPTNFIKIIIHHTGKSKKIQQFIDMHVEKNHWSSIGYHFMVSKKGTIYYSRNLKYAGAHTFGYNKNSIGIALFGNFDNEEPTDVQIESLNKLVGGLKENFKIRKVIGHNQAIYKSIKDKFWKLNLPDIDPVEIGTKLSYDVFVQDITSRVLEFDASADSVRLIKKFKSCPGFNMNDEIKKFQ